MAPTTSGSQAAAVHGSAALKEVFTLTVLPSNSTLSLEEHRKVREIKMMSSARQVSSLANWGEIRRVRVLQKSSREPDEEQKPECNQANQGSESEHY